MDTFLFITQGGACALNNMQGDDDGTGMSAWHVFEEENELSPMELEIQPQAPQAQQQQHHKMIPHATVPAHVREGMRRDYQALDDASYHNLMMLIVCRYGSSTTGNTWLPKVLDTQAKHLGAGIPKFDF